MNAGSKVSISNELAISFSKSKSDNDQEDKR
jgi:hypothetical protein